MKPMSLVTPEAIAREYGGNKKKIAEAARLGLLDPTAAVLAGMFIDKMRAAATAEQAQNTTVAQDILGGGLGALPTPPQQQTPPMPAQAAMQAQQAQPQAAPVRPELMQGVAALPADNIGEYAGGGIVAFAGDEGSLVSEDDIRRATPMHEYEKGRGYSNPEYFVVPTETSMDVFDISEPRRQIRSNPFAPDFTMGPRTPQERLAARLAFPPSAIGTAVKEAPPDLNIPAGFRKTTAVAADPRVGHSISPKVDKYGIPIPDPAANLAAAEREAGRLVKIPEEETQSKAIQATKDLYRDMGVDTELYKKHRRILEQERGTLRADKEEAKTMRILEAAAGILAGKSPHAFVNIGEGVTPAIKGLAQDLKDVKKADRELTRAQMSLDNAENQFKVDQSKSVQNRMEKNLERRDRAQQVYAQTTTNLANSVNSLSGSVYGDTLRDLTSRYTADQQYQASLNYAGATKYAADKDDRAVKQIMTEKGVGYTEALGLYFDARQRDFDRYNALRTSLNKAQAAMANDEVMVRLNNQISKLEAKPENKRSADEKAQLVELKNKAKIRQGDIYAQFKITPESLSYLERTDAGLLGSTPPPRGGTETPPPAAVEQLRANDTPQMRAYFDQTFGQGAAARALGR